MAQAAGIGPWPAGAGGGTRVTRARAADRRDQATTGPGGQRRGEGRARQRDAALTRDPVA
jgi:hypothetical protein